MRARWHFTPVITTGRCTCIASSASSSVNVSKSRMAQNHTNTVSTITHNIQLSPVKFSQLREALYTLRKFWELRVWSCITFYRTFHLLLGSCESVFLHNSCYMFWATACSCPWKWDFLDLENWSSMDTISNGSSLLWFILFLTFVATRLISFKD